MTNLYRNFLLLFFYLFLSTVNAATDSYVVTTIAGDGTAGFANGSKSSLKKSYGIAVNKTGDVFFSDTENHTIRRIEKSTGMVTTYAGAKDTPGTDNGKRDQGAKFVNPLGLTFDSIGNLYAVDGFGVNTIRKIDTTGDVTTIAGQANVACHKNAQGVEARFNSPWGITVDMAGHLYVADTHNHKIRKVDINTGEVTTVQTPDGVFDRPVGVAFDGTTDSIYVSNLMKKTIDKVSEDGTVTTIAGQAGIAGSTDGLGTKALLSSSFGLAVDRAGNIYVCDSGNNTIRKIDTKGIVTTIEVIDDTGKVAIFDNPTAIAVDDDGNLYVTDTNNYKIRRLTLNSKNSPTPEVPTTDDNTRGTARSLNLGAAAGNAATSSVEAGDGDGDDESNFRYSLNPQQLKLGMQSMKQNDYHSGGYNRIYAKTLETLEKTLGSTQALRNNGMGLTFWVSGLYSQGQSKPIYGNPSMKDHHYGIISGCHYIHKPTGQTIGLALDIGLGNSFANVDHEMKSIHHTGQMTVYYHKTFDKNWKFNVNGSFMRSADRHQRPYTADNGTRNLAIGHGVTHVYSCSIQVKRKCKIVDGFNLKPFVGVNYSYTKQFAYEEKNAGNKNVKNNAASMAQTGLEFGISATLFQPISDTKTIAFLPQITYTNFVRMGSMKQKIENVSTGHQTIAQSGTMGRHLLSATAGLGIEDKEAHTRIKIAYTGHFQKYHKSQEVLLNYGVQF